MAVIGGSGEFPQFFLNQSQTWTPPMSGNVCIHVIGGGSGGAGRGGGPTTLYGGSGVGYCKKNYLAVTPAGNLSITVGGGGLGAVNTANGGAGGASYVSGAGLSATLTATGGTGGGYFVGPGAGGTAANCDVNNTGGVSASGGGAVGFYGTGAVGGAVATISGTSDAAYSGGQICSAFGTICGGNPVQNLYKGSHQYGEHLGQNAGICVAAGALRVILTVQVSLWVALAVQGLVVVVVMKTTVRPLE